MEIGHALLLGVVQGVTEFLPISSDGHLALTYHLLGQRPDLTFEIFLHAATLLAMLAYFREEILTVARAAVSRRPADAPMRRVGAAIFGVTIVSAAVALAVSPYVEPMSGSLPWVAAGFFVTSGLLFAGEMLSRRTAGRRDPSSLAIPFVALIGALQGVAALPGVSRSGSTIAAGMFAGLTREEAARFSFLCGIPIITLAAAKDGLDVLTGGSILPGFAPSAAGFVAAALAGYAAIALLLGLVKRHGLWVFAAYTGALGTAILVFVTVAQKG